ncbi:MAG: metallophosphoesterase [Verrucomicrobia bacterium]|nr:metallophosphoesterase [Verrucomicrobiota bacterium]
MGLGAAAGIYTWRVEPHWLEVVERRLSIAGLPESLVGLRLVQLSDLHVGPRVDDGYLLRSFQRVKEMAPEFVVYTGDFTSYEAQMFDHVRRVFSHLPLGRRGTFGILGNHDYGLRWSQAQVAQRIAALATDAGVRVLRNERVEIGGLHIIGLDDLWADQFDLLTGFRGLPDRAAAIVLSHNPDTADLPGWGAYSGWILSGHTHGGQCKPPFLPPPLLPVRNRRYTCGEFDLSGGRRLYISRGVGHLQRVRFNVRPEITVFRMERA